MYICITRVNPLKSHYVLSTAENSDSQSVHIQSHFLLNYICNIIEISFHPVKINEVLELFSFNAPCTRSGINTYLKIVS